MINKKKAALGANQAAYEQYTNLCQFIIDYCSGNLKLPCTVEQYKQMRPYPVEGLPGKCLGQQCDAFGQVNPGWGYCIFHAAIRAMVHDAKRGNVKVREVLERMGVQP
ncbi:MAG: hypothetical protein JSS37_00055 [Proteobacteria bacterium]|jgi:hypothetical protein|nr:hypothetical protein [Pseudomonadota bacterium]